jgi:sugar phosphate isomerase/epimerase
MLRRTFLQAAGATLTALASRPVSAAPEQDSYVKTMGLQLYTLRNQLDKDLAGTLRAVADAGYYQVELMRVVGGENVFRAACDAGLHVSSAMIDWETLVHAGKAGVPSFGQTLEVAEKQQLKFLVIPYIGKEDRRTVDQMKAFARRANRAGNACRDAGIQLCYHHHSFEFGPLGGGTTAWDILVQECDPALVKFEIDTFWAAIGGRDPVKTIRDLGQRVAQVHLKDLPAGTAVNYDEGSVSPETFQAVGDGSLDWPAVLAAAHAAGVVQCHVEQDHAPDPLASIARSIQHLKSL